MNAKDMPAVDLETAVTQLGRNPAAYSGFVNTPIVRGSTVLFPSAEALDSRAVEYTYGRPSSPTSRALEEALAELEGGTRTVLTPSGLAAVSLALLSFAAAGSHILISDSVYQPTRRFAERVLRRMGVDVEYYDPLTGSSGIAALLKPHTRLVFAESPGSQTFEVQDIPAIASVTRAAKVPLALDNTWATPLYFRAFDHGVNVSIQSATKYIAGHADVLLGAVTCDAVTLPAVFSTHEALGLCASAEDCFLTMRGLRTLALRLDRHWRSGLEIAEWLSGRPEIEAVLHPAMPGDPGYAVWARDFTGAAGLFSVVLKPSYEKADLQRMLNALKIFGMGYSWGGFESLIVPFDCTPYRTATRWKHAGMAFRLNVGLESVADLKADLDRGFAALRSS